MGKNSILIVDDDLILLKTAEEFQRRLWENFRPVKLIWRN